LQTGRVERWSHISGGIVASDDKNST